jgi:tRNA(His) 5'-end guanylyltransferase
LFSECEIDFNNFPVPFRRGIACYRAPKIINMGGDEKIKNKLTIDMELPLFTKDHEFLGNLFKYGRDIIRSK